MSEAKHTPGPWEFTELRSSDDGLGYIRPVDWDGAEIAHHGDTLRSAETNRANARLIARAPDMDAALREAVEAMERAQWEIDDSPARGGSPILAALRAALARCRAALGDGSANG